jgi:hypothetical protein
MASVASEDRGSSRASPSYVDSTTVNSAFGHGSPFASPYVAGSVGSGGGSDYGGGGTMASAVSFVSNASAFDAPPPLTSTQSYMALPPEPAPAPGMGAFGGGLNAFLSDTVPGGYTPPAAAPLQGSHV